MTTAEINAITGAFSYTRIIDAVGPDIFTFEELVRLIAQMLRREIAFVHVNPRLAFYMAKVVEPLVGDVLITRDEVAGLMTNRQSLCLGIEAALSLKEEIKYAQKSWHASIQHKDRC